MKSILVLIASCTLAVSALAKLPALSDEAKTKAAEAAAKTAHAGKVDAYQLCKSQYRTVAYYSKEKKTGKGADKSACTDPGAFVYTPAPAAPPVAAAAPAAVVAAAPAAKK